MPPESTAHAAGASARFREVRGDVGLSRTARGVARAERGGDVKRDDGYIETLETYEFEATRLAFEDLTQNAAGQPLEAHKETV